eukprot:1157270-Pelagomonas_calceolata.AAC.17
MQSKAWAQFLLRLVSNCSLLTPPVCPIPGGKQLESAAVGALGPGEMGQRLIVVAIQYSGGFLRCVHRTR